jgi:hypothetical protein
MGRPALRFPKVKRPVKNRRPSSQPAARPKPLQLESTAPRTLSQPEPQAEVFCHTTLRCSLPLKLTSRLAQGTCTRASISREQRQLRSAAAASAANLAPSKPRKNRVR